MFNYLSNHQKIYNILLSHSKDLITKLHFEEIPFSLVCRTKMLNFDPSLSSELKAQIGEIACFILSGYSLQSLEIFEQNLVFEAGLTLKNGQDVGTIITVPYGAIMQILFQDEEMQQASPIFVNPFENMDEDDFNNSLNAILSKNLDLVD